MQALSHSSGVHRTYDANARSDVHDLGRGAPAATRSSPSQLQFRDKARRQDRVVTSASEPPAYGASHGQRSTRATAGALPLPSPRPGVQGVDASPSATSGATLGVAIPGATGIDRMDSDSVSGWASWLAHGAAAVAAGAAATAAGAPAVALSTWAGTRAAAADLRCLAHPLPTMMSAATLTAWRYSFSWLYDHLPAAVTHRVSRPTFRLMGDVVALTAGFWLGAGITRYMQESASSSAPKPAPRPTPRLQNGEVVIRTNTDLQAAQDLTSVNGTVRIACDESQPDPLSEVVTLKNLETADLFEVGGGCVKELHATGLQHVGRVKVVRTTRLTRFSARNLKTFVHPPHGQASFPDIFVYGNKRLKTWHLPATAHGMAVANNPELSHVHQSVVSGVNIEDIAARGHVELHGGPAHVTVTAAANSGLEVSCFSQGCQTLRVEGGVDAIHGRVGNLSATNLGPNFNLGGTAHYNHVTMNNCDARTLDVQAFISNGAVFSRMPYLERLSFPPNANSAQPQFQGSLGVALCHKLEEIQNAPRVGNRFDIDGAYKLTRLHWAPQGTNDAAALSDAFRDGVRIEHTPNLRNVEGPEAQTMPLFRAVCTGLRNITLNVASLGKLELRENPSLETVRVPAGFHAGQTEYQHNPRFNGTLISAT